MSVMDTGGCLALATDDALFQGPDGTQLSKAGMAAMLEAVAPRFAGKLDLKIQGTTSEGGRVAIEAKGALPLTNGHVYRNNYHYVFEIKDGWITSFREYCCTKAPDIIFADP